MLGSQPPAPGHTSPGTSAGLPFPPLTHPQLLGPNSTGVAVRLWVLELLSLAEVPGSQSRVVLAPRWVLGGHGGWWGRGWGVSQGVNQVEISKERIKAIARLAQHLGAT